MNTTEPSKQPSQPETSGAGVVGSTAVLGDCENEIARLTENHISFDETNLHIARQWMRAMWWSAMRTAANIAAKQANDDAIAADGATDMAARLNYLAQQERALCIEKEIRQVGV